MNAMLDNAIKAIAGLPEAEQKRIARDLLASIEADERWEALYADPRSEVALRRHAAEAASPPRRMTDADL